MPTYQYECTNCSHAFEIIQSMSENRIRKCPECGQLKLQRLIGAGSGIIFKGTGFYETDYKRKSSPKDPSGDSEKKQEKSSPSTSSHGCSPSCGCVS